MRRTVLYILLVLLGSFQATADERAEFQKKLDFMVGTWETEHTIPSREGEPTTVKGDATIEWVLQGSWLRHEFHAEFPGRGEVAMASMMNYSPDRKAYNFYMFDHFGGEAGTFYGDWVDKKTLVLTARFEEEDGTSSYQKFTLIKISKREIGFSRAFSDDGEHYHFELKGVYRRKG